jgi:ubiquinone biosynthesis protein UbiJ
MSEEVIEEEVTVQDFYDEFAKIREMSARLEERLSKIEALLLKLLEE